MRCLIFFSVKKCSDGSAMCSTYHENNLYPLVESMTGENFARKRRLTDGLVKAETAPYLYFVFVLILLFISSHFFFRVSPTETKCEWSGVTSSVKC